MSAPQAGEVSSMSISQQPTIGQRLLQERKKHSWSQQMLAEKIGTTVLNINRWEHEKTQPQPYYREKLCEVFGKSHDELFGEPEEEKHAPIWSIPPPAQPLLHRPRRDPHPPARRPHDHF